MDIRIFKKLLSGHFISEDEFEKIKLQQREPISVYWDLRTLLYLGISLLTAALGLLVYKNIDTIGHDVIIIAIAILCISCFWYGFKNSSGYSSENVVSPNAWFDYIVLMGCLLFLTFIGYLQFEYNIFGSRWGLATFIPMVILFLSAYYFDHLGVLSLAIVNLAAWVGINVTPMKILTENDFGSARLIYSGIILGALLIVVSFASLKKNLKAHFSFTYKNFGWHILEISLLSAVFYFEDYYLLWFLIFALTSFLFFKWALKENSFYFLVITTLYGYIGLSYVILSLLFKGNSDASVYLAILYFIFSGIALIWLFIHYNKIFKIHAGI
ncbi:MAG: DUF2157 domain-containing protein [Ginsengibacter sp.]